MTTARQGGNRKSRVRTGHARVPQPSRVPSGAPGREPTRRSNPRRSGSEGRAKNTSGSHRPYIQAPDLAVRSFSHELLVGEPDPRQPPPHARRVAEGEGDGTQADRTRPASVNEPCRRLRPALEPCKQIVRRDGVVDGSMECQGPVHPVVGRRARPLQEWVRDPPRSGGSGGFRRWPDDAWTLHGPSEGVAATAPGRAYRLSPLSRSRRWPTAWASSGNS